MFNGRKRGLITPEYFRVVERTYGDGRKVFIVEQDISGQGFWVPDDRYWFDTEGEAISMKETLVEKRAVPKYKSPVPRYRSREDFESKVVG